MEGSNGEALSLVRYVGESYRNSCGYCKSRKRAGKAKLAGTESNNGDADTAATVATSEVVVVEEEEEEEKDLGDSAIFGVNAHFLSSEYFNRILDIGWSRSGRFLYKPIMEKTCCPQYTIRLDVHRFRLSRTQKRVLRAMHDYLKYDKRPKCGVSDEDYGCQPPKSKKPARSANEEGKPAACVFPVVKSTVDEEGDTVKRSKPFEKKKLRRRRRALERLRAKGVNIEEYQRKRMKKEESRRRTIDSYLQSYVKNEWKHRLQVRLVKLSAVEHSETFNESYQLYKKYQEMVHQDTDVSRASFIRFLVSSPLFNPPADEDHKVPQLGSYHQHYVLDGKLIAVGVVDLLPRCVSAKYFYYDPDYRFLSLGTYSALREIEFTRSLSEKRPELHYYYMGFYLYDCPKMRYKGKFRPSELLCDKTFKWVPLTICNEILNAKNGKFSAFAAEEIDGKSTNTKEPCIDNVRCMYDESRVLRFKDFEKLATENLRHKLRMYVQFVGQELANEIVLCF